jgi:hypothetical protein
MEFRSNNEDNQRVTTFEKRPRHLAANDPQQQAPSGLDKNKKNLLSGAIASYLKQLYVKSGMQGNPKKDDIINQLNTILDHLPTAAKNYLSTFGRDLNLGPDASHKQLADSFIRLLLKKAFKNNNPYSQQHKEFLNNKVKSIIKKALEHYEDIENFGYQEKTVAISTKGATPTTNNTTKSHDQQVADAKLKAEQETETIFQQQYLVFVQKLHNVGSFLNLAKAYNALGKSATEDKFYADSAIVMQDDDPAQRKEISKIIFKVLNNPGSKDFQDMVSYLIKQGVAPAKANNLKDYFLGPGGIFPKDAKSLLNLILHPKQSTLFTAGKPASEVLHFRFLVLQGLTRVEKQQANTMYDPKNPNNPGTLLNQINKANSLISDYNDFLKKHPDVTGSKFVTKLTFNEATGGFVMFSTFSEEYQLAEADRQAASLQGEGYNKTLNHLQDISAGLVAGIDSKTDADTDDEAYFSNLTQEQLRYLGSLKLVEGGKTIAEQYFGGKDKHPTDEVSRATVKSINIKLGAIIKAYEDKNQKVGVLLQDATEKRNVAATTLSKILDKLYDVYKLVAQF